MTGWDAIVIGLGGMGSATCYELAQRGAKVLGIDRWSPPHDYGSSHGATRIIRRAYFEHPEYVPLVEYAYGRWRALEAATGENLLNLCGLIQIGPAHGQVIPGVLASVAQHGLEAEKMSAAEARAMFPQLHVPAEMVAVWEPGAGYLAVERCVSAHLSAAASHGAELKTGLSVRSIRARKGAVEVACDDKVFSAQSVIATPGPWAGRLLEDLPVRLQVRRKHLHWLSGTDAVHVDNGFATFLIDTCDGVFYGFPAVDQDGLKVAEHSGGEVIDGPSDRALSECCEDSEDTRRVRGFVEQYMPSVTFDVRRHAACYYTMTTDERFVVDRHPTLDNVLIAIGFSGHGFKFAPAIGAALAEMALEGRTSLPVEFLRLANRAL